MEGRPNIAKLSRPSSHQDLGPSTSEHDVRIITSTTKGKKFNRKNVIEQGTVSHMLWALAGSEKTDAR